MGKNRQQNCVSRSCHKKSAVKCSNRMCAPHCHEDGFLPCDRHAEKEDVGPKLRLSIEKDYEDDLSFEEIAREIPANLSNSWSPPCLQCGAATNANCSNALCDKHCLHTGKSECSYHENLTDISDIWECARTGNIQQLREWIEDKQVDVNVLDTFRNSPLFYASWAGQIAVVEYLLRNGAKDDPVLKRCWWNSYDKNIRSMLETYYEEQYCEKQVSRDQLKDLSLEERESILLQPIVRYLHSVRRKGFPPVPNTERFEIEQLIPDDVLQAAFRTIPTYDYKTGDITTAVDEKKDEKEGVADLEDLAFQSALSSLNNLRGSMNLITKGGNDTTNSKLEQEAAQLCAHSLEELLDMNSCKICFVRMVDCVIIPCGHLGFCLHCIKEISECPTCMEKIESKLKVFRV